jgi:hypothetical protein
MWLKRIKRLHDDYGVTLYRLKPATPDSNFTGRVEHGELLGHCLELKFINSTDFTVTYTDNGEPAELVPEKYRPCKICGEHVTEEGHDPCIKNLPRVKNACCGHGNKAHAYVMFDDDRPSIHGEEATEYFSRINVGGRKGFRLFNENKRALYEKG